MRNTLFGGTNKAVQRHFEVLTMQSISVSAHACMIAGIIPYLLYVFLVFVCFCVPMPDHAVCSSEGFPVSNSWADGKQAPKMNLHPSITSTHYLHQPF